MGTRHILIAVLLLVTWVGPVSAAGDLKCEVLEDKRLSDAGKFTDAQISYVGKEFVVDRATGKMIGMPSNQNAFGKPTLLHAGDHEWSLKALTIYRDKSVELLRVNTFAEGPNKPFIFAHVLGVASGLCEEF